MANSILPSYPAPPGNKPLTIATITGPASYTAVTPGTPATGGYVVNARDIGLIDIDTAHVSLSDNGTYGAQVIHDLNPAAGTQAIRLMFFTAATGAEVAGAVDLSGRTFRITAIGN